VIQEYLKPIFLLSVSEGALNQFIGKVARDISSLCWKEKREVDIEISEEENIISDSIYSPLKALIEIKPSDQKFSFKV